MNDEVRMIKMIIINQYDVIQVVIREVTGNNQRLLDQFSFN